jgi:hypothetical protein
MGNLNSTTVFISDNCLWDNLLKLFPLSTEKKQMAGLGIGVGSMKSGERALLHVGWELGYGKEGSFSFPNVPPMADLVYEVELIGFDDVKEVGKQSSTASTPHNASIIIILKSRLRLFISVSITFSSWDLPNHDKL